VHPVKLFLYVSVQILSSQPGQVVFLGSTANSMNRIRNSKVAVMCILFVIIRVHYSTVVCWLLVVSCCVCVVHFHLYLEFFSRNHWSQLGV